LDTGVVLAQLGTVTGTVLTEDGMCAGGQVGAAYVRWPDGQRSVLTCRPPGDLASVRRAETLLAVARTAGVPVPRYELVAELPAAVAIVQELLPGSLPETVDHHVVESMVEMNQRCRGLLVDREDVPAPSLYLRSDGPGFCLHEPLARYDRRTARLLDVVEEIGATLPEHLAGEDLVHLDYHPGNVLVDATGTVTGIVDWDAASRSNGDLDLYTLRFDLARNAPGLGRWLDTLLRETMSEIVAQACWAHMSLRMVDWSIRHLTPADVTAWLDVAEQLRP
jgi:aminoglycoside phosphotransferase (APT) family kinase protein